MAKQMVLNRKMYKEIKKMDHQDMSNYLSRYYQRKFEVYQAGEKGDHTDQRCAECTVPVRRR